MTRRILALALAALAPHGAARGGETAGPVTEIVIFRLAADVTEAAVLDAAPPPSPCATRGSS